MKSISELGRTFMARRDLTLMPEREADATVYNCPDCHGQGYYTLYAPGTDLHGKRELCAAPGCRAAADLRQRRYEAMFQLSGVPGEYRHYTFESWFGIEPSYLVGKQAALWILKAMAESDGYYVNAREVVGAIAPEAAEAMDDSTRNWVVLHGVYGTGKTSLACALVNRVLQQERQAVYYRLSKLFSEIQSRYSRDESETEYAGSLDELKQHLYTVPLLVIDEMRMEGESTDKRQIMQDLLRERRANRAATIVTTNETPEQLNKLWGRMATEPLYEMAHWVTVGGKRLRRGANIIPAGV
jgi:hypothetical protein